MRRGIGIGQASGRRLKQDASSSGVANACLKIFAVQLFFCVFALNSSSPTKIKTVCPRNCFDTCSIVATVQDGKITRIEGDSEHPITRGHLCAKGYAYLQRTYSPERVKYPLKRVGKRGEGKFTRVSWDEAMVEIASRLKAMRKKYGGEALMEYRYGGHRDFVSPLVAARFLNLYGATALGGTFCDASEYAGFIYTYGSLQSVPDEVWSEHTECVVIWGHRPETTHVHLVPFIYRAIERGAKLVVIDPIVTPLGSKADYCLQPRPGTDGALALGMANHILRIGAEDSEFIRDHTYGFEEYKKLVDQWPAEKASQVSGVSEDAIRTVAETIASKDTIMQLGMGMNRYTNSHNAVRAVACLAGLTGNLGRPGACCYFLDKSADHYLTANSSKISFPEGAGIRKNRRFVCITGFNKAVLEATNPPIKGVICWRGNPVPQLMNVKSTEKALTGLDLLVVIDQFMTDTADYADFILPACTFFEQYNLVPPYGHRYLQAAAPVIEPLNEARPDIEIWAELGRRVGFVKYFPENYGWVDWAKMAVPRELALESIINPEKPYRMPESIRPEVPFKAGIFPTPSGKMEFMSNEIVSYGEGKEGDWDPLPSYNEPEESPESRPDLKRKYPLVMISTLSPMRTHSQFINLPWMREIEGAPSVEINPSDADERGIADGDIVNVFNARGSLQLVAKVTHSIRKGTVNVFNGWWVKDGGCPNILTEIQAGGPRALGNSIFRMDDYSRAGIKDGQSGAYGCCLVEIKGGASQ
jgi:anaerobic selenocysteine-containing dehydrogenase